MKIVLFSVLRIRTHYSKYKGTGVRRIEGKRDDTSGDQTG